MIGTIYYVSSVPDSGSWEAEVERPCRSKPHTDTTELWSVLKLNFDHCWTVVFNLSDLDISDIEFTTSLQETGTEEEGESSPLVHFLHSQTGGIKPRLSMR